jgi:glucan 1,3-beta-glucosidase
MVLNKRSLTYNFRHGDHDIESPEQTRVNVYGSRGILVESKGPSWFHSVSNEHSTLYNWQLSGAENIYLGQIQSETPYFQAGQLTADSPYTPGASTFDEDPDFDYCLTSQPSKLSDFHGVLSGKKPSQSPQSTGLDTCREAWALRIIESSQVYIYGGGFYSFFNDYLDQCGKSGSVCQQRLIDTSYSEEVWIYNLYTVGSQEVISPQGDR